MTGRFYIDEVDALAAFGVRATSYEGLVRFAPLKPVDVNDWPDENGIDPDLSSPALDSKEFSIDFSCSGDMSAFMNVLRSESYHTFEFPDLGITRVLRLVSQPEYNNIRDLHVFSLSFVDDFPLNEYSYLVPDLNVTTDGFSIDAIDLSAYGMRVEYGIYKELKKTPEIKQNLAVANGNVYGTVYDGENVLYKSKNIAIRLLYSGAKNKFWRNYNALLYNLTRPGERVLRYGTSGLSYFYYLSSEVNKVALLQGDRLWCQFQLNLCLTMADPKLVMLLTSETEEVVVKEDDEYLIVLA